MKLGIPTLCRYDLLDELLRSAERGATKPSGYIIVDNGGGYTVDRPRAAIHERVPVELARPGRNLGVAASWNLMLAKAGGEALAISNDDVILGERSFERLVRGVEAHPFVGNGWYLFAQTPECTARVGLYDEVFWPAYYEDSDYQVRLYRAGITRYVYDDDAHHVGEASSPNPNREAREKNRRYFLRKWGGKMLGEDPIESFEEPRTGARICLNMIVRNESKVIERCLTAALPFIDTWVITDTGSTDGTPELIKRFFAERKVPGRLARGPFENFAQARNAALATARTVDGWDYALLLDADMVIGGALDKSALEYPAYKLSQQDVGLDYWNVRLLRRDVPATYVGVTHEYLSVEGAINLLGPTTIDDRGDGGSKGDKAERDIRLLNAGLAEEPNNARYMYYLANTYRETGRHHEAVQWYRRRIAAGGWDEEVWSAHYGSARCYLEMKAEAAFIKACLDAYNFRPARGEPLKLLAQFYRERGQNEAALLFAEALAAIDYPADSLFVERDVYDFGADQEIAIAGFYSPRRRDAGYRACARLTVHCNNVVREEARKNFTFYARSAKELFGAEIRPIDWNPGDGYKPMNPSVCVGDDGRRLVLVRTVNYTVTDGQYPTLDGSGIIRTRNHVLEMDAGWKVIGSTRIVEDDGPRSKFPVEGFEDCRLWCDGGRFSVSATVRDRSAGGRCEMAVAEPDEAWCIINVDVIRDYEHEKTQKNWMPIVGQPGSFLYLCDPTVVVVIGGIDGTVERSRNEAPACLVDLRGGSQLIPHGDGWLCLTHEVAWRPERVYLHRFVKFDQEFRIVAVSEPFYFTKVGIEFCAGLARDGNKLVASFGVNDASAHLAFFDPDSIDRALYAP